MNAIRTQVGQDYFLRSSTFQRRKAEEAYDRQEKYYGGNRKIVNGIEDLLKGNKGREISELGPKQFQKLDAGQVKQVALPIGKTLEETIDLWRDVRAEAISPPKPTTADYQLAATASSKIRQAEAQIGLHRQAKSEIERDTAVEEVEMAELAAMELPSEMNHESLAMGRRYERAISTYSFHVLMKKKGFEIDLPSFYKVA